MAKSKLPATYDDLLRLPENMVGEIIEGELIATPRPAPPHAFAGGQIAADIAGTFGRSGNGPGGWIILVEPELHFGDDVVVPDFAGWRRERMPKLPSTAAIEVAPDWVCSIVTSSSNI